MDFETANCTPRTLFGPAAAQDGDGARLLTCAVLGTEPSPNVAADVEALGGCVVAAESVWRLVMPASAVANAPAAITALAAAGLRPQPCDGTGWALEPGDTYSQAAAQRRFVAGFEAAVRAADVWGRPHAVQAVWAGVNPRLKLREVWVVPEGVAWLDACEAIVYGTRPTYFQ